MLSLSCSRSCFLVLSFVPRIVLFGALLCGMLSFVCFSVLSFVPRIVLFGALLRNSFVQIVIFGALPPAKNRALDRHAFYCSPSYQEACFLVLSFVPKISKKSIFPQKDPKNVPRLRGFCGKCKGRCLIRALQLVCGILLVNFRIKCL